MFDVTFPEWDSNLFVFLNSKNLPWLDQIMILLSTYTVWGIIFLIVAGVMIYKNRRSGFQSALYMFFGIIATLVLNNIIKLFFTRPRPGSEDVLKDIINQLEEIGNSYSFFSAHSSSSVCLATFSALYYKNRLYSVAIYSWALAVAYSRIYVGKHYPLDVIVGILFGLLMGWISWWFYNKYGRSKERLVENDE